MVGLKQSLKHMFPNEIYACADCNVFFEVSNCIGYRTLAVTNMQLQL